MTYATVCSGIEAPSVAWHSLGFKPVFFSEIEKFPSKVLAHHYPGVPNLGDMTKIDGKKYHGTIDIILGGTPCQPFSLAGLRKGLADPNGNLALVFLRLIDQIRPKWVVWENVPGMLSSWSDAPDSPEVEGIGPEHFRNIDQTNDFETFLAGFRELGYSCAWRILDAQYFGVPQRRRRVFVVAHIGDWRRAAGVLFERESLRWDFTPRKKQGEGLATNVEGGVKTYRRQNNTQYIMSTGQANSELVAGKCPTLTCNHEAPIVFDLGMLNKPNNRSSYKPGGAAPTIAKGSQMAVTIRNQIFQTRFLRNGRGAPSSTASALTAGAGATGKGDSQQCILDGYKVRRITPLECERLMGFPDEYTKITGATDGHRYKVLGNSIVVPVLHWIGTRIKLIDTI